MPISGLFRDKCEKVFSTVGGILLNRILEHWRNFSPPHKFKRRNMPIIFYMKLRNSSVICDMLPTWGVLIEIENVFCADSPCCFIINLTCKTTSRTFSDSIYLNHPRFSICCKSSIIVRCRPKFFERLIWRFDGRKLNILPTCNYCQRSKFSFERKIVIAKN